MEHDFNAVIGAGTTDHTIPSAALLIAYAEACIEGNRCAISKSRAALATAVGNEGLVDAAAVIAIFNAVVRIADATGIPLEPVKAEATADLRQALGLEHYYDD